MSGIRGALVCVALVAGVATAAPRGEVVRIDHHDPEAAPSRGPVGAPVTIELFFVPGLHSKQAVYRNLEQLAIRHPSRIRLIYRVLKANQANLANAALEALAQGKFFEMMTAIDDSRAAPSRDHLVELGRDLGLDAHQLEAAMAEDRYAEVLKANDERHLRLRGFTAPDALFNGTRPRSSLSALPASALEDAYLEAYARAIDLVDRGADHHTLPALLDAQAQSQATASTVVVAGALIDDAVDLARPGPPTLANPPLVLDGLPSKGPATAAVPIVVLCQLASVNCFRELELAAKVQSIYPDDVRVVWSPWFTVSHRDVAAASMLGDAALCAESLGDGWDWLEQMAGELARRRGRPVPPEQTMDTVDTIAALTQVNRRALARCQAELAGASLARIAAARRAGVKVGPSVIVGGRIYAGGADENSLQALVEAELAPGVLGALAPAVRRD